MSIPVKCTLCGKQYPNISCGTKSKAKLKRNETNTKEHICQYCKRKGTEEFKSSFANHQQHEIYFNEEE